MNSFNCQVCGTCLGSMLHTDNQVKLICFQCTNQKLHSLEVDHAKCSICSTSFGRIIKGAHGVWTCVDCGLKFGVCTSCLGYSNDLMMNGEFRPLQLFTKDKVCSLNHSQMPEYTSFKLFDISNGLTAEVSNDLKLQMKLLYMDFLLNVNLNPKIMKNRSVDQVLEIASKTRDDLFINLDNPANVLHRKRYLVACFKESGQIESQQRRKSRELRGKKELVGFTIVEWHKNEGFTSINNIILRNLRADSRLLLDICLISFKLCVNQQKIETQNLLAPIAKIYKDYFGSDFIIPVWMYVLVPPQNTVLKALLREDHEPFFSKLLLSIGWTRTSSKTVDEYKEWSVSIEELEEIFFNNATTQEKEMWSTESLTKYLEWRSSANVSKIIFENSSKSKIVPSKVVHKIKKIKITSKSFNTDRFDQPRKRSRNSIRNPILGDDNSPRKKKPKHCRCCGTDLCPGRGGVKFCKCANPDCERIKFLRASSAISNR